ncbi:MAG: hypothetical protein IKF53_05990 [Clostridia bacterium]|nr:hypothetical protein [Clostridia bacterium]
MKKIISLLLVSILCLFCFAGCGKMNVSEEEAISGMQSIYEANKTALLLTNHKSLSYDIKNPYIEEKIAALEVGETIASTLGDAAAYKSYAYETNDFAYIKKNGSTEYRMANRLLYFYNYDDEGQIAKKAYYGMFGSDYAYCSFSIVPAYDTDWFDKVHETIKEYYEKDGELHILIEMDEIESKYFIEDTLHCDYDNEMIKKEIITDAKSYEIKKISYINTAEKEEKTVYSVEAEYDVEPKAEVEEMRKDFEESDGAQYNGLLVLNPATSTTPGATPEIRIEFKVNAGYSVSYKIDPAYSYTVYTDPACTNVASGSWDKNSDIARYILTKKK